MSAPGSTPPTASWGIRSLRFRIVATVLAALLAMTGAQGFLLWQQQVVSRSLALITDGYLPLAKIVASLERDRQRVDTDVRRLLGDEPRPATGKASTTAIYTEKLRENLEIGRIKATMVQRQLELTPEEQAVFHKVVTQLDVIERLFSDYQAGSAELVAESEAGNSDEAKAIAKALIDDGKRLGVEIDTLSRLLDSRIHSLTKATETAQLQARAVAIGLTSLAVLFSLAMVVAVLVALRPIGVLTTEVQRLAAGQTGGRVEVRGADEVAILATEFNAMVRALEARDRALVLRAEELNRLSRYLASVLDGLQDALLVVESGKVTLANPAARTWDAIQGAPPPPALALPPGRHEVPGPGHTLHEVRVTPFGGNGVVVVCTDVTEQTLAKHQLARSERLALVGQMLAQITHEVRNPLNALSLNAELLADELGALDPQRDTEAWDLLDTVSKEIERLTAVTAHYLQLARRPPARLEPADPAALVRDVARLLAAELEQEQVTLEVVTEAVGLQLIDQNQLRQALLNVVRNATEAGGRHLRLVVEHREGVVALALSDDGPGMTPEQIERATDPFWSTKASGTGLGLAITKQILDDHGGALEVTSIPGEGTEVALLVPYRPATLPAESAHVTDHPGR